jgi:hypothetical protein
MEGEVMGRIKVSKKTDYTDLKKYWIGRYDYIKKSIAGWALYGSPVVYRLPPYSLFKDVEKACLVNSTVSGNGVDLYYIFPEDSYVVIDSDSYRSVTFVHETDFSRWCRENYIDEVDVRHARSIGLFKQDINIPAYDAFYYEGADDNGDLYSFIGYCKHREIYALCYGYLDRQSIYLCRTQGCNHNNKSGNLTGIVSGDHIIVKDDEIEVCGNGDFNSKYQVI